MNIFYRAVFIHWTDTRDMKTENTYIHKEIKEIAKKARIRGSTTVATKICEVLLIELENDCYPFYAMYIRRRIYAITEESRAFQRTLHRRLRNCAPAMVEFSPAQIVPRPSSSPCHCVCIIMLITTCTAVTMRQPRFRKRLEKEHIAEQILTEQIISFLLASSFMSDGVCSRSLEAHTHTHRAVQYIDFERLVK